jgi:hypothetical protein
VGAVVVHVVRYRHQTITIPRDGRAHMVAAYGDRFTGLIVSEVVLHDPPRGRHEQEWFDIDLGARLAPRATITSVWPPFPPDHSEPPSYIR